MKKIILLLISAVFILASTKEALAITTSQATTYVEESFSIPQGVPSAANDLARELEEEVIRILDKGHLEPTYFELGIVGSRILHGYPGEQASVLAQTLPYLTPATQTRLKNFLAQEVRSYDLLFYGFEHGDNNWGGAYMTGNRREYFPIPVPPAPDPISHNLWPEPRTPVDAIYMVWQYAHYTGDWAFISTSTPLSGPRWDRLRTLFSQIPTTPTRYGEVNAAIGFARILAHFGMTGDPLYSQAIAKVQAGFSNPTLLNFRTAVDDAQTRYLSSVPGHRWVFAPFHYLYEGGAVGFHFSPEVGRFLRQHALTSVEKVIVNNPTPGEKPAIATHWPEWFITRGAYPDTRPWTGHYGENILATPDNSWAIFMVFAHTLKERPDKLRYYLSVPFSIGDLTYIQKLTATIQAHSSFCWKNIRTGAEVCESPPSTPGCPTDINGDSITDLTDYSLLALNFLEAPPTNPKTDINTDGITDLTDYSLLALQFLKVCSQ